MENIRAVANDSHRSFEDIQEAHRDMESNEAKGKMVVLL